jgi:mono/diheme cytochrome c family protein
MKRSLYFTTGIFLTVLLITSCSRYNLPFREQQIPATADVQEGQVLYMRYCQKCHPFGEAGLGPSVFYLPGISKKIQVRMGLGVMPSFDEHVIADDDLDKIMKYMKALK